MKFIVKVTELEKQDNGSFSLINSERFYGSEGLSPDRTLKEVLDRYPILERQNDNHHLFYIELKSDLDNFGPYFAVGLSLRSAFEIIKIGYRADFPVGKRFWVVNEKTMQQKFSKW